MRTLELLAPAKDLECGKAAIDHGADAVYIGADRFGARAAAGNSIDDIAELCRYAHLFGAKVYVTVNTIIYEAELEATQQLVTQLAQIHVDAILVQDMATLAMRRVTMEQVGSAPLLHASTQCDTRSAEKVRWLRDLGFARVVLARELSVKEIAAIHQAVPDVELEVFVHGALCVSYSGVCYASQHCFGRSANRGECAQFCRMKFDLIDADGKMIEQGRHLLSLKDMSQIDHLEVLAEAGASSFKIEGRLKDVNYVKNVVSAYSQQLNRVIALHPDRYVRASWGRVEYRFEPSLRKTFNRGYTHYFLDGRRPDIASFDTPKALGEQVGRVKEIRTDSFNVAGTASFANGDGLCFINDHHELEGFRVNRVVGNRLFPFRMPRHLKPDTVLYRNNDEVFGKILAGKTAERRLPVALSLHATPDGFALQMACATAPGADALTVGGFVAFEHQRAKSPQTENIIKQLSKLGNTIFVSDGIRVDEEAVTLFIPSSLLSELRRQVVEQMMEKLSGGEALLSEVPSDPREDTNEKTTSVTAWQPEYQRFPYIYNIANHLAREFYVAHGLKNAEPALEVDPEGQKAILMQCRHCLRYTLGFCVRHGGQRPTWHEPLSLRLGDGRQFRLEFKCDECQMNILEA
jgi:putative protease